MWETRQVAIYISLTRWRITSHSPGGVCVSYTAPAELQAGTIKTFMAVP